MTRCYPTATSERGHGWVGYLPLYLNARSEASEHAFARRVISRQDPLYLSSYFGAHKNKKYYLKAFHANLFQCLYDILMFILQKRFFRIDLLFCIAYILSVLKHNNEPYLIKIRQSCCHENKQKLY